MIKDEIHQRIIQRRTQVHDWFASKRGGLQLPFYSSFDIRDANYKIASVDANLFPAGFNNICPTDQEYMPAIVGTYIKDHYGNAIHNIGLLTEEHTNNPYYWDNVNALQTAITEAGFELRVFVPRVFEKAATMTGASGAKVTVYPAAINGHEVEIGTNFKPDLIISNNDFSVIYDGWNSQLAVPMNPPQEMGWHRRKKSHHFRFYNQLAGEFAECIGIDPWTLQVQTELVADFDFSEDAHVENMASRIDKMISEIQKKYEAHSIKDQPFVFIKNNSGTYGLGVMSATSGEDIRHWSSKVRKQMKATKGKKSVNEFIIQEGVRSALVSDVGTAEPAIYIVGCELIGGFLRTHKAKGPSESLNSPGAVYKRLCVSDLKVSVEGHPLENVYGWVARLGSLAIGCEFRELGVTLKGYKSASCDE